MEVATAATWRHLQRHFVTAGKHSQIFKKCSPRSPMPGKPHGLAWARGRVEPGRRCRRRRSRRRKRSRGRHSVIEVSPQRLERKIALYATAASVPEPLFGFSLSSSPRKYDLYSTSPPKYARIPEGRKITLTGDNVS